MGVLIGVLVGVFIGVFVGVFGFYVYSFLGFYVYSFLGFYSIPSAGEKRASGLKKLFCLSYSFFGPF